MFGKSFAKKSHLITVGILSFLTLLANACSCNDYPIKQLRNVSLTQVIEEVVQQKSDAVDILFVIDNSGSMREEQAKLRRNFRSFITELVNANITNFHIGVVTTDVLAPDAGFLRQFKDNNGRTHRYIAGYLFQKQDVIKFFSKIADVGTGGNSYEMPLEAMRLALFERKQNQGFLRKDSALAVIIVSDEDDCSLNANWRQKVLKEQYDPELCYLPSSKMVGGARGLLETLVPVQEYIRKLKGLNRPVVVGGIIGDPYILVDKKKRLIVAPNGCRQSTECGAGRKCQYFFKDLKTKQKMCGGCASADTQNKPVEPAFRIFELIRSISGEDFWFPICGDDEGFKNALLRFAGLIINILKNVPLKRKPAFNESIRVQVTTADGNVFDIPPAKPLGKQCPLGQDSQCQGTSICGPNNVCYGDGWVLFIKGERAYLKLSGNAVNKVTPGSKVRVYYITK